MSKHDLMTFPCLYCAKRFDTERIADRHMLRAHRADYRPADLAELEERLPHRCRRCKRRFATIEGLEAHTKAAH